MADYETTATAGDDFDDLFEEASPAASASSPLRPDVTMSANDMGELDSFMKEGMGEADVDLNKMLEDVNNRELDRGEKADDAEDFEDIGDDDLPDEEDSHPYASAGPVQQSLPLLSGIEDIAMDGDGGGDLDDDLFGGPISPVLDRHQPFAQAPVDQRDEDADDLISDPGDDLEVTTPSAQAEVDEIEAAQWRTQLALFAQSGKGSAPTTEEENIEEWLKLMFPQFKHDEMPFFNRLLPPKPARWIGKAPLKAPKPLKPTKVHLELDQDQRALFNSSVLPPGRSRKDGNNVVILDNDVQTQDDDQSVNDSDLDEPLPGGLTMEDLTMICADIDTLSNEGAAEDDTVKYNIPVAEDDLDAFDHDDLDASERPVKKRRVGLDAHEIASVPQFGIPYFDEPERLTRKLAQKVILDLNDPQLLLEEYDPDLGRVKAKPGEMAKGTTNVKDVIRNRFNMSNDAEYDLLKQNHQHKVRGQLGHMSIDHAGPAVRLQYPYYKVKLPLNELRNFHRKKIEFKHLAIHFNKPNKQKRKHMKVKSTKEAFVETKDLSMGDNSSVLLLEYSEEHPMMISQVGMGNRVINYYRQQNAEDKSRPKKDIGETSVLLQEDKSPFHIFGHIRPGEEVMALYNSMYRAPIFQQDIPSREFVVIREHTGQHGFHYYLRNMDHLYTVGQELPSVTIPGPHSRVVTTAAKNRLKAISFRIARRKKTHRIRVEEVTRHFPDTTDMQNRQKMKEFMSFSKEHKEWEMRQGEVVPDEEHIQGLIKPEDVCLLESMQVGQQYLQDAGYGQEDDDEDENEKEMEGQSIEQELAPWKSTKNFIHATQGKAMLKLYGDGDPSGRGEAFSFIKTSMKGGFRAEGAPVQDMIMTKKELGGHSYNVARQQQQYEESIARIWRAQKDALSSKVEHSQDFEDGVDGQEENDFRNSFGRGRSETNTPAPSKRRDDDTMTSFSRRSGRSGTSQTNKFLVIRREVRRGGEVVVEEVIESNPAVIKQYKKIRERNEDLNLDVFSATPTGNADTDARQRKRIEEELLRLQKNKERRHQREKAKGIMAPSPAASAMSPDATDAPTPAATGGKHVQPTQRKCANCGQVGHIKTNKKCAKCDLPYDQKVPQSLTASPLLAALPMPTAPRTGASGSSFFF